MTWHKKPKTKKETVENMQEIMSIPDELILQWVNEAIEDNKK